TKLKKPQSAALKKLEVLTARDLLMYFPYRHLDFTKTKTIKDLTPGENISLKVTIKSITSRFSFHGRMSLAESVVSDETGSLKVVWFNQGYLAKSLSPGDELFLAGAAEIYKGKLQLTNPIYEKVSDFPVHTSRLVPIYHLKAGLYPKTLRNLIKSVLPLANEVPDILPADVVKTQNLPTIVQTIIQSHFPESDELLALAQKRLAFEEIFFSQLAAQKTKLELEKKQSFAVPFDQTLIKTFLGRLPFELTIDQKKATWEILQDIEKTSPMNRLLEGDVGSGKTLVAFAAALQVITEGLQVVFLAPTEILAKQHFDTAKKYFLEPKPLNFNTRCVLFTQTYSVTNDKEKKKAELLKEISNGMPGIYFGTHALLQKTVNFQNLALVVIDEQHRWGVEQRSRLISGQTRTETQTNADKKDLLYEELTYKIRNCVFEVKKELGLGHKEKIYQNALELKFKEKGILFEREKNLPIIYKNKDIGSYQPDFIIDKAIIIELKALPFIGTIEKRQAWTYLKSSDYKLALLINFASDDVHIERIIYDTVRVKSALSPRQSANERVPHLLSLSATPIPRTLKLAFFGELSLSQIKAKPKNRKPIATKVVSPQNRVEAYDFISKQIATGRQAFVITPLVEESDKLGVKSAVGEAGVLQNTFPELKIGLLHGRLKGIEKESAMTEFLANRTNILVANYVVEVGVDVPNASVMIIEGAERFGLSQLHQFRGR
ncbi:MAG: GxxExxY protein, partial [Patescibacteria group bacterium]